MANWNFISSSDQYARFPQLNADEVKKLRDWVELQPHLPDISELEAIVILHSCRNSMEAAKICVDTYFTMRTHCKDFFAQRSLTAKGMQTALSMIMYVPLPGLTKDNHKVIYCKVTNSDPSLFNMADCCKLFWMIADLWIMQEGIAEGHVIVFDMDGIVFGHLARLGLMTIKKTMDYLQEAFPVRLKGLHFLNTVSFMDKVLALIKPFMKKDLLDVLYLHSSVETFTEFVPLAMLPNECGGKAGGLQELKDQSYGHLAKYSDFFAAEEKRTVLEKARPGKSRLDTNMLEGNFKKLDID